MYFVLKYIAISFRATPSCATSSRTLAYIAISSRATSSCATSSRTLALGSVSLGVICGGKYTDTFWEAKVEDFGIN